MSDYLDLNNEELLKDFFSEAEQQVINLESNILVIENDPSNHEAVDEIFRAAHTLKGGSATVEMHELSEFTHVVEDILDEVRAGHVAVTGPVIDILLESIDIIKAMLQSRSDGSVYDEDVEPVKQRLRSFLPEKKPGKGSKSGSSGLLKAAAMAFPSSSASVPASPPSQAPLPVQKSAPLNTAASQAQPVQPASSGHFSSVPDIPDPSSLLSEYEILELKQACPANQKLWGITVIFDESNLMNTVGGIQVFAALKEKGSILKTIPDFDDLYGDEFQPRVVYFVASSASASELEDASFLGDVTDCTDARLIESAETNQKKNAQAAVPEQPPQVSSSQKQFLASETKYEEPAAGLNETSLQKEDTAAAYSTAVLNEDSEDSSSPDDMHENVQTRQADRKNAENTASDKPDAPKKASAPAHANSGSVLRVDSKRIDYLLNLVSETVITKAAFNQSAIHMSELLIQLQTAESGYKEKLHMLFEKIPQYLELIQSGRSMKEIKAQINTDFGGMYTLFDAFEAAFKTTVAKFRSSTQNLGRIAGELQEGVMKIRMVPISQIFSRFPRVVRDLSRDLDKVINLVIEGEDTELDKSVVEDLLDPIMHCVRNSLDHGIETPSERLKNGKPEEGTLLLKASNEGNLIIIDIIDDGKGIDIQKVRAKAVERGIIHPNKIISDQEAYQLIFEAGFSTSDKITNVSGRGVGLDVVKTQIEKLNGSVVVSSQPGKGTKFSIRLPLTLAIIQGLLVRVGSEVYSIPIASVIESHRVKAEEINTIDNYEVLNVRNEVISVLRLSRLFGIKNKDDSEYSFIVIVGSADKKIGVMVDALIGEEDVVIKPLRDQFTNSPGIAGASILGDGSVSLIIDVSQLLELGVKQELNARQERDAALM